MHGFPRAPCDTHRRSGQYIGRVAVNEGMTAMNSSTHAAQRTITPALLRLPDVLALVRVSKATLYRWASAGMFPQPRALTPTRSTVAWSAAEVHGWIASKLAANDGTFDGISHHEQSQAA